MWEVDQCVEVVGEPTRRWRRPQQNIVTNLCGESRKGLTEGLRNFIQVDNHRALEVGHLRDLLGFFKERRSNGEGGYPEVLVRESPNEITLGADEVGTWKSCTNVDRVAKERKRLHPGDYDRYAFSQALHGGMEKTEDSFMVLTKKRAGLYGVKKPQDAQNAKPLWKMKAAKEEYFDPTREDNILGKISLKDPITALDEPLKC